MTNPPPKLHPALAFLTHNQDIACAISMINYALEEALVIAVGDAYGLRIVRTLFTAGVFLTMTRSPTLSSNRAYVNEQLELLREYKKSTSAAQYSHANELVTSGRISSEDKALRQSAKSQNFNFSNVPPTNSVTSRRATRLY